MTSISRINTREHWASVNPVLLPGETAFESITHNQKVGDGRSKWNDLPYYGSAGYWGEISDNADQTAASADTPQSVQFRQANLDLRGVKVISGTQITVDHPGVYTFTFNMSVSNNDSQIHDIHFWLRKNNQGSAGDVERTDARFSIVESHGGEPGNALASLHHTLVLGAGDYIELVFAVSNTNVYLRAGAAQTSPYAHPSVPSAYANVVQVASA